MTASLEHLTERQKDILRSVIQCFIQSATPVASQHLAARFFTHLSPATIRNELADLEEKGYIDHPHTSAGRVPTDKGYRVYVDNLIQYVELTPAEKRALGQRMTSATETEEVLQEASKILGKISHQLGIVTSPHIGAGVLEKIELVPVSTVRVLVILTMRSGIVKTITMEVAAEIRREKLERICQTLNERLAGLTLAEIRDTFADRIKDLQNEETGLIRLFIYSSKKLFDDSREREKLYISGTQNIVEQPEFQKPGYVRTVIELLDDADFILHVLEQHEERIGTEGVSVTIGNEHKNKKLENYSLVISRYHVGDICGTIGLIGPKRMNYAKAVPLVDFAAQTISHTLS